MKIKINHTIERFSSRKIEDLNKSALVLSALMSGLSVLVIAGCLSLPVWLKTSHIQKKFILGQLLWKVRTNRLILPGK